MTDNGTRPIPRIEAVHIKNYRVLKDVQLREMTPLTVLIGPNGSGKSTLFDVFAFLSECFAVGLPEAWARRGGMRHLRSMGAEGPITIEVKYREEPQQPIITYHLEIDEVDRMPSVNAEWMQWRRKRHGRPFRFMDYASGNGYAITGDAPDETAERSDQPLTSPSYLAVNTLGTLKDHPRVVSLRNFISGWYLSNISAPGIGPVREAGPQPQLSASGDNLANVLQHLQSSNPDRLISSFLKLSHQVPQLEGVASTEQPDGSLLLLLKDRPFDRHILARYASTGTMKLLAYLLVLDDPFPPPLIGIEEPENFVHPGLLRTIAEECLVATKRTQLLVSTHAPQYLDALSPNQIWILERGPDGFTTVRRASEVLGIKEYIYAGGLMGDAWEQQMLEWPAIQS